MKIHIIRFCEWWKQWNVDKIEYFDYVPVYEFLGLRVLMALN